MIEIKNPELYGSMRLISERDAIPLGWVVIAMGVSQGLMSVLKHHLQTGSSYPTSVSDQEPVQQIKLLIGELRDKTIARLSAEENRLVAELYKNGTELKKLDEQLKQQIGYLEKREAEIKELRDLAGARGNALLSESARRQKLEDDLAKVRKHFGDKAFKEAIS